MSSAAGVPGTRASSNCKLKRAAIYVRRRPERSAAYQVVRQNLETWLAQPATAPAIAPARSPPMEANAQQLIAPEAVEAIPEIEFDQTANLEAQAGHDRLVGGAGADAEPIPELEFDQTFGWQSCTGGMAHAAERE